MERWLEQSLDLSDKPQSQLQLLRPNTASAASLNQTKAKGSSIVRLYLSAHDSLSLSLLTSVAILYYIL